MKELVKLMTDKIKELTGLVAKFSTEKASGNTPHINLFYKGLQPVKLFNDRSLKKGYYKFDVVYQGQLNNLGDTLKFAEYEERLFKLFTQVGIPATNKEVIKLENTTDLEQNVMILIWNNNELTQGQSPFTEDFADAKRTFKLQLYFNKIIK